MFRIKVVGLLFRVTGSKRYHNLCTGSPLYLLNENNAVIRSESRRYSQLVASAFASLKQAEGHDLGLPKETEVDTVLDSATTVDDLLVFSKEMHITKHRILKIISILNMWVADKKIVVGDFDQDPRFLKLCTLLNEINDRKSSLIAADKPRSNLHRVVNYSGDDEAAKLISKITTPQIVKIMVSLGSSKRRSITLLQALSFNLCQSKSVLNLKQCSDILYSMSVLNYHDENLIQRLRNDLLESLHTFNDKTPVIGSIVKSLGHLKYFDMGLLDLLSDCILRNLQNCRNQDIVSLVTTLAHLNYLPSNSEQLFEAIQSRLKLSEMSSIKSWIDVVWSLTALDIANSETIESVLNPKFIQTLNGMTTTTQLKLLNINAAAKCLVKGYKGPTLKPKNFQVEVKYSKEKNGFVDLVVDALSNLLNSTQFYETNISTDMGFNIVIDLSHYSEDVECLFDEKSVPIQMKKSTGKKATRVAFLIAYYHDVCSNDNSKILGEKIFAKNLLEAKGYKVIIVPYSDFRLSSKMVDRVTFLDAKLKECINC